MSRPNCLVISGFGGRAWPTYLQSFDSAKLKEELADLQTQSGRRRLRIGRIRKKRFQPELVEFPSVRKQAPKLFGRAFAQDYLMFRYPTCHTFADWMASNPTCGAVPHRLERRGLSASAASRSSPVVSREPRRGQLSHFG